MGSRLEQASVGVGRFGLTGQQHPPAVTAVDRKHRGVGSRFSSAQSVVSPALTTRRRYRLPIRAGASRGTRETAALDETRQPGPSPLRLLLHHGEGGVCGESPRECSSHSESGRRDLLLATSRSMVLFVDRPALPALHQPPEEECRARCSGRSRLARLAFAGDRYDREAPTP